MDEKIVASSACPIEPWFAQLLAAPVRVTNGILDFRARETDDAWARGQQAYERWMEGLIATETVGRYQKELEGVRDIYEAMPIIPPCLDVGGCDGRVRAYMPEGAAYACVDPYPGAINNLSRQPALLEVYPALRMPVNFVCGFAEHLPVSDGSFKTVHMRSVIDHFSDPHRALKEAWRVLEPGGQIIVGISVFGGRTGIMSLKERAREILRAILVSIGIERYRDDHIWHPTLPALRELTESAGFDIDLLFWQKGHSDRVVYIRAKKAP